MKISDIISVLESWAPLHCQENYDNSGLQVGNPEDEFKGGLICLDVSMEVLEEAVAKGCNMVVSHHPVLFHPLRQVVGKDLSVQVVSYAITHQLNIYSAHTNLDNVKTGVSTCLGELLGMKQMKILQPKDASEDTGSGVFGCLEKQLTEEAFIADVKKRLNITNVRCSRFCGREIRRVAVCGGAGGFLIPDSLRCGADAFLVGEAHYHDFVNYKDRLLIVEVGHFESESCIKAAIFAKLNGFLSTFAVSEKDASPYVYL